MDLKVSPINFTHYCFPPINFVTHLGLQICNKIITLEGPKFEIISYCYILGEAEETLTKE